VCRAVGPEPTLAAHAKRAINGIPEHAACYQWLKEELMTDCL